MLLILFLISCSVATANEGVWKNPAYSPVDNIDSAMRGYNIYTAEPFAASQIDPGFHQLIFESTTRTADGSVSLQPGIDVTDALSCKIGRQESVISSMEEYRDDQLQTTVLGTEWKLGPELDVNAGLSAGPASIEVSTKIEPFLQGQETDTKRLTQLEKFFTTEKGVMVKLQASCLLNKILLDRYHMPPYRAGFMASISKLYEAYRQGRMRQEFKLFVQDYGLFYSTETFLGARLIHNRLYTEKEHKQLTTRGLVDCSKQQTKISLFVASLQDSKNLCSETTKDSAAIGVSGLTREETISFGSRPHSQSGEWSRQDFSHQVPIKQRLVPIWRLFDQLPRFDLNITDTAFATQFRELYDDICDIMGYGCPEQDVCGVPGPYYSCGDNQTCVKLLFPEKGAKKFFCENSKPTVHWARNESATGYTVQLRELGSDQEIYTYAFQCDKPFCNVSFTQIDDNSKTYVYKVITAQAKVPWTNTEGTAVWTSAKSPTVFAKFNFSRIETANGYHMNVRDLNTMRTYYEYLPQCGEQLVVDWSICLDNDKKRQLLFSKPKIAMAQTAKQLSQLCNEPNVLKERPDLSPFGALRNLLNVRKERPDFEELAKQNPIRCDAQFPAEVGDYDIIIIANTQSGESIVQQIRVKV